MCGPYTDQFLMANFVDLSCLFFGDYFLYAKHFSFPFRLTQLSVGHWIDFTMRRTPVWSTTLAANSGFICTAVAARRSLVSKSACFFLFSCLLLRFIQNYTDLLFLKYYTVSTRIFFYFTITLWGPTFFDHDVYFFSSIFVHFIPLFCFDLHWLFALANDSGVSCI